MLRNTFLLQFVVVVVLALSIPKFCYSQKDETYTASNGMVFSVGDTVTLGVGADPDGKFRYIYSGITRTLFAAFGGESDYDSRLPAYFNGQKVKIRKIKASDKQAVFTFDTEKWAGYVVEIENAISECELAYCRPNGFLSQQEYEKLVLLYQAATNGDITIEKFGKLRDELIGKTTDK